MKGGRLILICLVLSVQSFIPGHAVLAATNGCVANWYVSYGGTGGYTLLRSDPLDLPLSALRFDRSYNDPTDLSHGYLDFNHDGKSDVFATILRPDGNYQWMYSSGATSDWIDLAYAGVPPADLRFGDFDGDGYTDVFAALPIGGGLYQWVNSSKGTGSFQNLAYAATPSQTCALAISTAMARPMSLLSSTLAAGFMSGWFHTAGFQAIRKSTAPSLHWTKCCLQI